jgi:isoleucyl-tRNA synthetase
MADHDRRPSSLRAAPAQFDLPRLEEGILRQWDDNDVEGRSLRMGAQGATGRGDRPAFAFYDGPPFATGLPHYGHILPSTIKDIVPRYQQLRGFAVERRFGWDCHGLPIESLVEEQLGVHGKAEIEAYGIAEFNAACKSGVLRYTEQWRTTVRRIGRWVDFENDYKTMDPPFMETVWWVFRQLWDAGLVYEGHRVQPVSPILGTPLSNFEVAQGPQERDPVTRKDGHKRRQDPSITVRFAIEGEEGYLWAWTTTPWTLPSNLALAVHPDLDYVKVRVADTGEIAWLEPGRLADYQSRGKVGETEELARVKGRELVGKHYRPLFDYFADRTWKEDGSRWAFRVVGAEYVSTDAGTGIVHQAPAFGEEDYEVGKREGLPLVNPVSLQGIFDARVGEFAGQQVKDADKGIVAKLKHEGKLVDGDTIVHPYPHSYRTDEPLLYMALSTWFVKVEQMRDRLVANNDLVHWVPGHVGSGRFGNWLAAARDWNVARNRYWGTPIPIWRCDANPEEMVCVGSIAELESLAGLAQGSITDLHRETVDAITFPAKTPGGTMRRVTEVFDCWFESGSMPYAQNHYPFDPNKREYVEKNIPCDFIAEGLDQTRGWFYTLHVLATALFDKPSFKNVIVNGLVLAEDGKKMSKRLKNYPDPLEVVDKYGADALRAYLVSSAAVRAEPMRFSEKGVRDTVRTAMLPLWNAYNFLVTYARADGWSPSAADLSIRPSGALDRWVLSRVESFVEELEREFDDYALSNCVPAFTRICDDVNNWYIRRGRRRYWRAPEGAEADKRDAYGTLFRVLVTVTKAISPVIPFVTDWLYQRLVVDTGLAKDGEDSVHLARWPERDASVRDAELERAVAWVRSAVAVGQAVREREKIAVRRPLPAITVASPDAEVRAALSAFADDVLGELNVKSLDVVADDSKLVTVKAKANFKVLGKRVGGRMKELAAAIGELDAGALAKLARGEPVVVLGETLGADDVLVTREIVAGNAAEVGEGMTVVLDTRISPELRREGLARELVNRVQNLRKSADLDVSQRIALTFACDGELADVLRNSATVDLISTETLARTIEVVPPGATTDHPHSSDEEVDGAAVRVALKP